MDFSLFSLNTHLFGRHSLMPKWNDFERAETISEWLRTNKPDVVAMQEVWDEGLFDNHFASLSDYPQAGYGGDKDLIGLNSGLAILSMIEGHEFEQKEFETEAGVEALATKGWVKATLKRAGTFITIFNTHTQANRAWVREEQLKQLAREVQAFREENRSHVVFVTGDFNVAFGSDEYRFVVKPLFQDAREVPLSKLTYSNSNALKRFFDSEAEEARLDYIFYFSSLDGKVSVKLKNQRVVQILSEETMAARGFETREVSDHWGVFANFSIQDLS